MKHIKRWVRGLRIAVGLLFCIGMAWFLGGLLTLIAYGVIVLWPLAFIHSVAFDADVNWAPVVALVGALVLGTYEIGGMRDDEIGSMLQSMAQKPRART